MSTEQYAWDDFDPEERSILEEVARSHGRDWALRYWRLILSQAVLVGELEPRPKMAYADAIAMDNLYIEYRENLRRASRATTLPAVKPLDAIEAGPKPAVVVSDDEATIQIASSLRRLTEEGGGHNFIILVADETKNYFVQFGTSCGSAVIYGEAVSDRYLRSPFALTRPLRAALLSLGWRPPTRRKYPNFYRYWPLITDADRRAVAEMAVETLKTVYGWRGGPLQVKLHLDW